MLTPNASWWSWSYTIRIYNPVKNGLEHDPDAIFIDKWVPELKHLPIPFKHEPFKMTALEQTFYDFKMGEDYPSPIINVDKSRKMAANTIWAMKKDKDVISESHRILNKHVIKWCYLILHIMKRMMLN